MPPHAPRARHEPEVAAARPLPLPRVAGEARIGWSAGGLQSLYQRAPARFLFPEPSIPGHNEAVLVVTSGGLTGGDTLTLAARVGGGASATLVTQAAERFYRVRSGDPDIRVSTRLRVEAGASIDWLAQEAILFDGTRLRRALELDLSTGARVLAVESLVFGRRARGETFATGRALDVIRVRRDDRLVLHDALAIGDDDPDAFADRFRLDGAAGLATLVYAGPDAASHLPLARALVPPGGGGASAFDDLLFVRLRDADARALRDAVTRAAGVLREAVLGLPRDLPRVWAC